MQIPKKPIFLESDSEDRGEVDLTQYDAEESLKKITIKFIFINNVL